MVLSIRRGIEDLVVRTALWVVPVADLGGVARHVLDVAASGLPGYRIVVVCPPGPLAERLTELSVPVLTAGFGQGVGVRASVATLHHHIRAIGPVVVHSHLSWADVVTAAAVPLRDRPVVVTTEHGIAADTLVYHGTRRRSRGREVLHQARLRRADVAIAVSRCTAEVMTQKWRPRRPPILIRNGVDRPTSPPGRQPGLRILSLARLAPEKRIWELVEAVATVRASHPGVSLEIAGTGPDEGSLRRLVEARGLASTVTFTGYVDAEVAMARNDVLGQLSVWENASYSLLDACAHGLGVVATPVGGNPEILPTRCLVDPTDPEEAGAALVRQGLDAAARPGLPVGWPGVASMCREISALYDETVDQLSA